MATANSNSMNAMRAGNGEVLDAQDRTRATKNLGHPQEADGSSAKRPRAKKDKAEVVEITAPRLKTVAIEIEGTAPYMQNKFSAKARQQMRDAQEAGSTGKKGKKKEAKDFMACYEAAMHKSGEGWCGIPAPSFRNAMISACRLCGFKMTHAKLSVFIEADGFDETDGTPLVQITRGEPRYTEMPVRNASGVVDLRARPMWSPGWRAIVKITYDEDMLTAADVGNLLSRAGQQVGIGEGRPDSKQSCGLGFGLFRSVA